MFVVVLQMVLVGSSEPGMPDTLVRANLQQYLEIWNFPVSLENSTAIHVVEVKTVIAGVGGAARVDLMTKKII